MRSKEPMSGSDAIVKWAASVSAQSEGRALGASAPFDARRLIDKPGLGEGLVPLTWQE